MGVLECGGDSAAAAAALGIGGRGIWVIFDLICRWFDDDKVCYSDFLISVIFFEILVFD